MWLRSDPRRRPTRRFSKIPCNGDLGVCSVYVDMCMYVYVCARWVTFDQCPTFVNKDDDLGLLDLQPRVFRATNTCEKILRSFIMRQFCRRSGPTHSLVRTHLKMRDTQTTPQGVLHIGECLADQ